MSVMVGTSLPPCRGRGVPVHHDPVHGIVTNPGNREWGRPPLSFSVVCDNPVHRVMVNWDPPISQYLGLPAMLCAETGGWILVSFFTVLILYPG